MAGYPVRRIGDNPDLAGFARFIPNVVFSRGEGYRLRMQLMLPWDSSRRYPCIVFMQGSSWTYPNVNTEIPQLAELARRGYVVATVTHRNTHWGYPFPANLVDLKTAIRFLRAHAADYQIDPERVGIWGTSSGGNLSLLVGLTGDDERYRGTEWTDESDAVALVVDCFGPTDCYEQFSFSWEEGSDTVVQSMVGRENGSLDEGKIHDMSPLYLLEEGRTYPPFLIMHGDADVVVPYGQSERFYQALRAHGSEAEMVCVDGAGHEGDFWSRDVLAVIFEFINSRLGDV